MVSVLAAPEPRLAAATGPDRSDWAAQLATVFRHVAIFALEGISARVVRVYGIPPAALGASLSLLERTPLRWSIEAASPVVGAGKAPGGGVIAAALGLPSPRTYAVVPLVQQGIVTGLAYADAGAGALKLAEVAHAFTLCQHALWGARLAEKSPQVEGHAGPASFPHRSSARLRAQARLRERRPSASSKRRAIPTQTPPEILEPSPLVTAAPSAGIDESLASPNAHTEHAPDGRGCVAAPPGPTAERVPEEHRAPPPRLAARMPDGHGGAAAPPCPTARVPEEHSAPSPPLAAPAPASMPPLPASSAVTEGRRWSIVALGVAASTRRCLALAARCVRLASAP